MVYNRYSLYKATALRSAIALDMWNPHFEGATSACKCTPSIGRNFDAFVRLEQSDVFHVGTALVTLSSDLCAMLKHKSLLPARLSYAKSTVVLGRSC